MIENLEYNTERTKLIIPEYGRHLHKMIDQALACDNKDERNKMAKAIIGVMGNLNPHLRDVPDFQHKLWDQLFIMSDFGGTQALGLLVAMTLLIAMLSNLILLPTLLLTLDKFITVKKGETDFFDDELVHNLDIENHIKYLFGRIKYNFTDMNHIQKTAFFESKKINLRRFC